MSELEAAFSTFLRRARTDLSGCLTRQAASRGAKSLSAILPRLVKKLEAENEFLNLVHRTRLDFSGDFHLDVVDEAWGDHIHNLFCQSGFYLNLSHGESFEQREAFAQYCEAFTKRESYTRHLVPLEFVSFSKEQLDLGTFKVAKFTKSELETILRQPIRRIFYPETAFTGRELDLLAQYWFLDVVETRPAETIGRAELNLTESDRLLFHGYTERQYSSFGKSLENAVTALCLFDWLEADDIDLVPHNGKGSAILWHRFSVPFVIHIAGEEILEPNWRCNWVTFKDPDTRLLELDPVQDNLRSQRVMLDDARTADFMRFVKKTKDMIDILQPRLPHWEWLGVSLGYFEKASLTEPCLDQILWYITSIEALLGESGMGVSRRLARRVGKVMGTNEKEMGDYSKRFTELYDLRNSLVHGGRLRNKAHFRYFLFAEIFARRTVMWFLQVLNLLVAANRTHERDKMLRQISREDLLALLDLDNAARKRQQWVFENVKSLDRPIAPLEESTSPASLS